MQVQSTPSPCSFLQVLILDEADLLLSYGYEDDVAALAPQVGSMLPILVCTGGCLLSCGDEEHAAAPAPQLKRVAHPLLGRPSECC